MSTHWILHVFSGDSWQVHDPVDWLLENADQPLLERARDGLLALSADEHDRIIRLVVRRCPINLIEIQPAQVVVQFWVKMAELRPYFKKHGLARKDVKALLRERKHEVITVTTGAEFLYGLPMRPSFPVDLYNQKWNGRNGAEQDDLQQSPGSWTSFSWDGIEARGIPWTVLKMIWRNEEAPLCPNCDQPILTIGFGWRRTFFNRYPKLIRICLRCHRHFEDGSCWEVDEWVVKHLDEQTLPRFHKVWNFIAPWTPPRRDHAQV